MVRKNLGKIIIYYGRGGGKTSAGLGRAIRMLGHKKKVVIIQFMKGKESGEYKFFKTVQRKGIFPIEIYSGEFKEFLTKKDYSKYLEKTKETLNLARDIISQGECDLLILDEILYALGFKLIKEKDILELLKRRGEIHIILTGGYLLPKGLPKIADQVSHIKKIKHYFDQGEKSIEGLDF